MRCVWEHYYRVQCTRTGVPRSPVRCVYGGDVQCYAQRLGPGSVLYGKDSTCGPVGPGGTRRCYRTRVPKVFVTRFSSFGLRSPVGSISVVRCDPMSNRAPGPGDGIPPGTRKIWEPCAPDFLTRQRKYAPHSRTWKEVTP